MSARTRSLWPAAALLAIAAGAVAFAWYGVARKDEVAAARQAAAGRLFAFEPAQVQALTLQARGETNRLVRDGGGWRLDGARPAPAQRRVVDAIVEAVARLGKKAVLEGPEAADLGKLGLAHPEAQVTLALEGGRSASLAVGAENPYDGSRFVRTGEGAVALVDGAIAWRLGHVREELEQPPPPPPAADGGVDAGRPSP